MKKFLITCGVLAVFGAWGVYKAFAQASPAEKITPSSQAKILVAYYSYSGNTKEVAEAIHEKVGGDLFEIKTEGAYPEEYRAMTTQAQKEIQAGYRPKLISEVDNISQYNIIFLGSPNWWGTITPQVSSFLEKYDLSGKTVVPFITHGGGGQQNTIADMIAQCKNCQVVQEGWVGYGSRTMGINGWLEDLGL